MGTKVHGTWLAHEAETWTVAWAGEHTLHSGGDDGRWRSWDVRAGAATPVAQSRGDAGVTAIAPEPVEGSHVVATGGYDDTVRLWDVRKRRAWRRRAELYCLCLTNWPRQKAPR